MYEETLFKPLAAGELELPNRVIMAPLTRCRASPGRVPNAMMAEYYAARAGAGLIISEATSVTPMGVGYPDTPGIWSRDQVEGWRIVTDAVHAAGGKIVLQLWHVGRISHSSYLDGAKPVAPSAIAAAGHVSRLRPQVPYETPRALDIDEIPGVVEAFRKGAENARTAGFDGVEIHAANGYLIDQFLQDKTNKRTDSYGGSIENRSRLLMEIVDSVSTVWSPGRIGVHLAPRGDAQDAGDSNPKALFTYVAEQLGKRNLAFLFAREYRGPDSLGPLLKSLFGGVFIANEDFTAQSAADAIEAGEADAVAFGDLYISNPDLAERFRIGAALNATRPESFYGNGPEGYTDYPKLERATT